MTPAFQSFGSVMTAATGSGGVLFRVRSPGEAHVPRVQLADGAYAQQLHRAANLVGEDPYRALDPELAAGISPYR